MPIEGLLIHFSYFFCSWFQNISIFSIYLYFYKKIPKNKYFKMNFCNSDSSKSRQYTLIFFDTLIVKSVRCVNIRKIEIRRRQYCFTRWKRLFFWMSFYLNFDWSKTLIFYVKHDCKIYELYDPWYVWSMNVRSMICKMASLANQTMNVIFYFILNYNQVPLLKYSIEDKKSYFYWILICD